MAGRLAAGARASAQAIRRDVGGDVALAAFLAFLLTLPFARPGPTVGGSFVQLSDFFLGAAFGAFAVDTLRRRREARHWRLAVGAAVFVLPLAISILAAERPVESAPAKLLAFTALLLVPWLAANLLTSERRLRLAVGGWLFGLGAALAIGLFQVVAFYLAREWTLDTLICSYGRIPEGPYPRVCAPFRNPNLFANYLATSIPLLLVFGPDLLTDRWNRRWFPVALGVAGVVTGFTLSSGIGGVAAGVAVVLLALPRVERRRRERPAVAVAAAALAIAVGAALATTGHTVPEGHGHVELAGREWNFLKGPRVHTWLSGLATVREHPVIGVGYGALVARSPRLPDWYTADLLEPLERPVRRLNKDAHNVWLSVLGQAGLLGLAGFVAALVLFLLPPRGAPRRRTPTTARLAVAVLAGLTGALLYHGLFGSFEEARHLWALIGLGAAAVRLRPPGGD